MQIPTTNPTFHRFVKSILIEQKDEMFNAFNLNYTLIKIKLDFSAFALH